MYLRLFLTHICQRIRFALYRTITKQCPKFLESLLEYFYATSPWQQYVLDGKELTIAQLPDDLVAEVGGEIEELLGVSRIPWLAVTEDHI